MSDGPSFARVPRLFFGLRKSNAITRRQFEVACAIMLHANQQTGKCCPRASTISELTGIAERHVRDEIGELEKAGALIVVRNPGKVSHYKLP